MKVKRDSVLGHIHLIVKHISIFRSSHLSPQPNVINTTKAQTTTVSVSCILNKNDDDYLVIHLCCVYTLASLCPPYILS